MKKIFYICILIVLQASFTIKSYGAPSTINLFSPNSLQKYFTRIESSETVEKGRLGYLVFLDSGANTLALYDGDGINPHDQMNFVHLGLSYGLTSKFELGLHLPYLFGQSMSDAQINHSIYMGSAGLSHAFFYAKHKILNSSFFNLSVLGQIGQPFSTNVFYDGEDAGINYSLVLALDKHFKKQSLGLNLGYTKHNPGERGSYLYYEPIESVISASLGYTYFLNTKNRLSLEALFENNDMQTDQSDREKTAGELSLSYGRQWRSFTLVMGAGLGLLKGVSEPDYRVFIGLRSFFSLFSTKKDETTTAAPQAEYTDKESLVMEAESEDPLQEETASDLPELTETDTPSTQEENPWEVNEGDLIVEPVPRETLVEEPPKEDNSFSRYDETNAEEFERVESKQLEKFSFSNVLFHFDSYRLSPRGVTILNMLIDHLNEIEFSRLEVWGHTDSVGRNMYNERLSLQRAKMVQYYLNKAGNIPLEKIKYDGWGERRPVGPNDTKENRKRNRRVEFVITK